MWKSRPHSHSLSLLRRVRMSVLIAYRYIFIQVDPRRTAIISTHPGQSRRQRHIRPTTSLIHLSIHRVSFPTAERISFPLKYSLRLLNEFPLSVAINIQSDVVRHTYCVYTGHILFLISRRPVSKYGKQLGNNDL